MKLNESIKLELENPKHYKPISKGKAFAILMVIVCLASVPFYILKKLLKRDA